MQLKTISKIFLVLASFFGIFSLVGWVIRDFILFLGMGFMTALSFGIAYALADTSHKYD